VPWQRGDSLELKQKPTVPDQTMGLLAILGQVKVVESPDGRKKVPPLGVGTSQKQIPLFVLQEDMFGHPKESERKK
jgi:hypothetical protein